MQITMTHSRRGSEGGFTTKVFEKGQTREVSEELGRRFIRQGVAHRPGQEPFYPAPRNPFGFRF